MTINARTVTKPVEPARSSSPASAAVPSAPRVPETKPSAVEFKSAFVTGGTAAVRAPGAEDIRRRAYEIYQARRASGAAGSPESDWAQAERELRPRT